MKQEVLIVDDEDSIRELIKFNLEKSGYVTREAKDGRAALLSVQEQTDLILLDLMLPEMDGLEVCRALKSNVKTAGIPVIMLTAKDEEIDKVLGLELGADDYMTKPFSPRELIARIKAVLRRTSKDHNAAGELKIGRLTMNFASYKVWIDRRLVELTPKEYDLLKLFVTNIGRAYSREQLLDKIWGYEYYGDSRTVDVHIRHLRAKLQAAPEIAAAVETVRGVGYRFAQIEE